MLCKAVSFHGEYIGQDVGWSDVTDLVRYKLCKTVSFHGDINQ